MFARGKVASANLIHASNCLRPSLKLPQWNPDGLKMGLCRVPPLGASSAVLCLKNSPAIAQNFDTLKNRFNKLYQVKAMLHHYTQIVDSTVFEDAINDLEGVIECYKNADRSKCTKLSCLVTERGIRIQSTCFGFVLVFSADPHSPRH